METRKTGLQISGRPIIKQWVNLYDTLVDIFIIEEHYGLPEKLNLFLNGEPICLKPYGESVILCCENIPVADENNKDTGLRLNDEIIYWTYWFWPGEQESVTYHGYVLYTKQKGG